MTSNIQQVLGAVTEVTQSEQFEQFRINARDFLSARESGESVGTQIAQMSASLNEAAEIFNRSFAKEDESAPSKHVNVISPVVVPKDTRSYGWVFLAGIAAFVGLIGLAGSGLLSSLIGGDGSTCFGGQCWLVWLG